MRFFGFNSRVKVYFYLFLYILRFIIFILVYYYNVFNNKKTDFDVLYKTNIQYFSQLFLFFPLFIAFEIKTLTVFLNTWLLKVHVKLPFNGNIILANIILKLSLYSILRLILFLLPKTHLNYIYYIYLC